MKKSNKEILDESAMRQIALNHPDLYEEMMTDLMDDVEPVSVKEKKDWLRTIEPEVYYSYYTDRGDSLKYLAYIAGIVSLIAILLSIL